MTLFLLACLTGCEHNISVGSTVYEDGSIDRTITLHNTDPVKAEKNLFGIGKSHGWDVVMGPPSKPAPEGEKTAEVNITFKKHFPTVEDANRDMDTEQADTTFHIASSFKKENRWFYTYIEYREAYRPLNRFNAISKHKYFTKEDFAFIDRLPAEGTSINSADSLYLARLNEKIFDVYGARTVFEEFYQHMVNTLREYDVPRQWTDTVARKKEEIYQRFVQVGNLEDGDFLSIIDDLRVPLPSAARASMTRKTDDMERRLEFISEAYSGKYVHTLKVPWTVVASNADTVINNELVWRPPVVKFLFNDYTMSVTSRKMNTWAVVVSAVVLCVTVLLFVYKRGGR